MDSNDPNVRKLLGLEGDFCAKIGISNAGCFADVISQLGNNAEIYNRNLGPQTVFDLPAWPEQPLLRWRHPVRAADSLTLLKWFAASHPAGRELRTTKRGSLCSRSMPVRCAPLLSR